ncbi:hypothetical protein [Streptomyces sp. NPDC003720]|uniref:hypothetical protein n=2 Tax=unclassified Streptomyces TaxID=2593676 RepID=UPI0036A060C1
MARDDPAVAAACDVISAASVPHGFLKPMRLAPERVARFLAELRTPGTTVLAAAAAVGVSDAAIYQRRTRSATRRSDHR